MACTWSGSTPSVTEDKHVDELGQVTRSWHAICPRCFKPARWIPEAA
jgi:hypothetical protein